MKKRFLLLIISFLCISVHSQVYKTVTVDTAGTLDSLLTAEELATITDLTLSGTINSDDYTTMKNLMPVLKAIDLGAVQTAGDSIPGYAFRGDVLSVILPSSVTKLGILAFASCSSLTTLTIPYGVTSIPYLAFAGCSSLTSLILPETVTFIGKNAFAGCSRLPFIDLPDSVTYIGEQAFVSCDSMSLIVIPPKVTELVPNAFAGSSWLDSVVIGSSVSSIGMYAFAGCNNLKSITIPASVDSIAMYAFVGCPGLTSVTFLSSSECTVGDFAFAGNTNLATITFGASEGISLGKGAFVSCSVRELNMASESVKSIGEACFIGNRIDTLVFPSTLKYIGKYAFSNSDSLRSITFLSSSGTSLDELSFQHCTNLVTVSMNSPSVDSIGAFSFAHCFNLSHLTLPSSMVYIGAYAFRECKLNGTLIMSSALKRIGEFAFYAQPVDTLIFLPGSGISLGQYSFAMNPDLTSIIIYSPSVDTIGSRCFSDCQNLKTVILPSSLASIQYGAFGWDYDLEWFRINSMVSPVFPEGTNVFPYWSGGPVDLYVPAGTKEAYQSAVFWSFFNIKEYNLELSASNDTIIVADTITSTVLDVYSTLNWQVSSDQSWLTAYPEQGMDSAFIVLTAEANTDTVSREAAITLSGINVPSKTIIVIQDPMPALSVSGQIIDIGWEEGSMAGLDIFSNQEWTIESGQSWLEVSQTFGGRSQHIVLTAGANPVPEVREVTLTIYTDRLSPQIITVIQAPKLFMTLSAQELEIGSVEGSTSRFNILSNTGWNVHCDQSWLSVNPVSGSDSNEITVTAQANPDYEARNAIITVNASGVSLQTINVTQQASILSGFTETEEDIPGIYPNPFSDVLYIDHASGNELVLLDAGGRIILTRNLNGDHEILDLSFLSSGEYLLKIGNRILKLVK